MIEIEKPKIETEILSEDGTSRQICCRTIGAWIRYYSGQQPKACAAFISTGGCSNI